MVKVMTFITVVVLVANSGAFAQAIFQYQNWNLDLGNSVNLSGSPGSITSLQSLGMANAQNLSMGGITTGALTMGTQTSGASVLQTGSVGTAGVPFANLVNAPDMNSVLNGTTPDFVEQQSLDTGTALPPLYMEHAEMTAPLQITASDIPWDEVKSGGLQMP
jgi:hypothetical protein